MLLAVCICKLRSAFQRWCMALTTPRAVSVCVHMDSSIGVDARFLLLGFLQLWTSCCVRWSITPSLFAMPSGLASSGFRWQGPGRIDCQDAFAVLCCVSATLRQLWYGLGAARTNAQLPSHWEIHVDSGSYGPTRSTRPLQSCFSW